MKIESDHDKRAHLNNLNKGLKDQILFKEAEIENVKKLYEAKIADQKKIGEEKLYLQHDLNQVEIAQAIEEKEERLQELKENYQKTMVLLEQERMKLEQDQEERNRLLSSYRESKFQDELHSAAEETHLIQDRARASLQELKDEKEWKLLEARTQAERELNQAVSEINQRNDLKAQESASQLRSNEQDLKLELEKQKLNYETNLAQEENRHQMILNSKEQELEGKLNEKEAQFGHLASQKEQVLQNRYDQLLREHEELMHTTKTKFENEYQQLVASLTSKKAQFVDQSQDPFYRINTIEPIISDDGDSYRVQIPVAEHEKDNVSVSPNGRQLKVTLTRNFSDRLEESPGNVSSSKRSEIFSRQLQVPELMNPRGITQRYDNGLLEILIKKA